MKRKTKKTLLIISIVIAVLAAGAAAFYFLYWQKREPVVVLTDAQILVETKSWEKQDAPTVIWTFNADGTGELTTNKSNYYDFTWTLEDGEPSLLKIQTAWLLELSDTFEFTLNREDSSFTVLNRTDNLESTFVKLGSSASEDCEETCEDEDSAEAATEE